MSNERRRRGGANPNGAQPGVAVPPGAQAGVEAEQTLAFEEALGRLDEAVGALEGGQLPLADALDLYEEGMRMAQRCQELLDQAELRVQRLQVIEADGVASYTLDEFDLDEEE